MGASAIAAEKLTDPLRMAMFGLIFRDPVMHHEYLYPDPDPRRADTMSLDEWRGWNKDHFLKVVWSQYPLCLWNTGIFACGRGVGKTEIAQVQRAIQKAAVYPKWIGVTIVRNEDRISGQLFPKTKEILTKHPVLKCLIESERGSISKGDYTFTLRNRSAIHYEYPGIGGRKVTNADRLQGLRATELSFEEAQHLNKAHVQEAVHQQQVTPTSPDDQANRGAGLRFFGVPDGDTHSMFYDIDFKKKHPFCQPVTVAGVEYDRDLRWKLPSPGVFYYTAERHAVRMAELECDPARGVYTQKYVRDVWALWGKPAERLFSSDVRESASVAMPDWRHLHLTHGDFKERTRSDAYGNWIATDFGFMDAELPAPAGSLYGLGIDVGTSALTTVLGAVNEGGDHWRLQWLVALDGWRNMHDQCVALDYLCKRYPVAFIGIDGGGPGRGIIDPLKTSATFRALDYVRAIYEFFFQQPIIYGYGADEDRVRSARSAWERRLAEQTPVEQKDEFYHWSMNNLRDQFLAKSLLIPNPDERDAGPLHNELESITQSLTRNASGNWKWEYQPSHPHYVSGLQCLVAAMRRWTLEQREESSRIVEPPQRNMFFTPIEPLRLR